MVGCRKISRSGVSIFRRSRIREMTFIASTEWPPISKKFSSIPIGWVFRIDSQIATRAFSFGVVGATYATISVCSGAGSAARSSFPFGVSGSASSAMICAGTRCSGSRCFNASRRPAIFSSLPASATTYATSRRCPAASSCAITAACRTPACAHSAASTSAGSTRKPRIFTCWSTRPR